jgi:hypothetical protein
MRLFQERSPLTRGNASKIGQLLGARFYFNADDGKGNVSMCSRNAR